MTHSYTTHFSKTILLSFPVIVAQLGNVMMGLIDNLMIGELGYVPLSASSLANGIYILLTVMGIGISFAMSALVAEADTAGKDHDVRALFQQGGWLGLFVGMILAILVWGSALLLPFMNQPEEDVVLAMPYLQIIALSAVPQMIFLAGKHLADGLSFTKASMYITITALGVNVFFNWLLINGNWGFPALELNGAGYATLISRIFMMALMIWYILRKADFRTYQLWDGWQRIRPDVMGRILRIGIPSGLQYFFEVAAFIGTTVMIGWLENGSLQRSAHQIALQMASLTYMVVWGLSAGSAIRVGNALGQKDLPNLRRAGIAGTWLAVIFMSVSAVVMVIWRTEFSALFVDNQAVIDLAAGLLILGALFQLFDGIQAVGIGILRGIQDVKLPTIYTFIAYWVIALPVGYLFGFEFEKGVEGIWYGLVLGLLFASVVLLARFRILTRPDGALSQSWQVKSNSA
ncbi:MAG: MATE family efflux transporter [Bacteroidota bacterium]